MSEFARWWNAEMSRVRNLDEFTTAFFRTWARTEPYVPDIDALQRVAQQAEIRELIQTGFSERGARKKVRGT
jgi:hypothetical protein